MTPSACGRPLLYSTEHLSVYHAWETPKQGEAHSHDDLQIALPLSGTFQAAWQTVGGRRRQRVVSPGGVHITASHQPHSVRVERETELGVVWLPAAFLARSVEEMAATSSSELRDDGVTEDTLLQPLCLALLAEVRRDQAPARLYVDAMAHLLALHVLRHHAALPVTPDGGLSRRRLAQVLAYIEENLGQDIVLADLAAVGGLSPSHFGPLFRRSVGLTPYQYVLTQRIRRAEALLRAGRSSVGEVALQVGFCDQSQFTRQFKRQVGLTPRAFVRAFS